MHNVYLDGGLYSNFPREVYQQSSRFQPPRVSLKNVNSQFAGTKNIIKQYKQAEQLQDSIYGYSALHARADATQDQTDEMHPPPAVTERIQSVQVEHIEQKRHHWAIADRTVRYAFPIVNIPKSRTTEAYCSAIEQQIQLMYDLLSRRFHQAMSKNKIPRQQFDHIFSNIRTYTEQFTKHWSNQDRQPYLLRKFLEHISTELYEDLVRMFANHNVKIEFDGSFELLKVNTSTGRVFGIPESLQDPLEMQDDELVRRPSHAPVWNSFDELPHQRQIAEKYVLQVRQQLLHDHRYLIEELPDHLLSSEQIKRLEDAGEDVVSRTFRKCPTNNGMLNTTDFETMFDKIKKTMTVHLLNYLRDQGVELNEFH